MESDLSLGLFYILNDFSRPSTDESLVYRGI